MQTNLGFLTTHIIHRPQGSQLGQVGDDDDDSEPSSSIQQAPSKKRQKRHDVDAALIEYLAKSAKQVDAMSHVSDEKQAWVEWMLQALRPLPKHLWREYTKDAFALVNKYIERAESEQLQQQQLPQMQPQQQQQPQQVRTPTPQMAIPPRPVSLPTQWTQDMPTQMPNQMYAPMYPWTGPASNSSQGNTSFNLSDYVQQAAAPSQQQQQQQHPSTSQPSDIVAAAARVLTDDR